MSNDIESHKQVCRHLYEEISRVFIDKGVVSHDFALAEKLYKKTMPQTIMLSRIQRVNELEAENKKLLKINKAHLNNIERYQIEHSFSEFVKVKAENKKLKEALGFYASRDNWIEVSHIIEDDSFNCDRGWQGGKLARQALKEIER